MRELTDREKYIYYLHRRDQCIYNNQIQRWVYYMEKLCRVLKDNNYFGKS